MRRGRKVAKCLANSIDRFIQSAIKIDKRVPGPDPGLQLLPGHQLPWALQQCSQHLKRLVLQLDLDSALTYFAGLEINLKQAETDWRSQRHRRWGMQPRISVLCNGLYGNISGSKNQVAGHRIFPSSSARSCCQY